MLMLLLSISFRARAQEKEQEAAQLKSEEEAAELAKKLANPIGNLISVLFQNNTDYGIGPYKGTKNTMNFQRDCTAGLGTEKSNLESHKSGFLLKGAVNAYFPKIVIRYGNGKGFYF